MISIEELNFSYETQILSDLRLNVEEDDRLAIIGENGTGKTTLLKIIGGIERRYEGKVVNHFSKISFVPSDLDNFLLPWYTIAENLAFYSTNGNSLNFSEEKKYHCLFENLMPKFDKENFFQKKIYKISTGQKAILSILCSLACIPNLIILDEIFSNLSILHSNKVIEHLKKQNITYIFTSHSQRIVENFSTRTFKLSTP